MEISGKLPPVYSKQGIAAGQATRKAEETKPVSAAKTDKVAISQEARQLQAARQAVRSMPEVDMDKVAKIKAQLENDTYKVDAQTIAANMLQETLHDQKG